MPQAFLLRHCHHPLFSLPTNGAAHLFTASLLGGCQQHVFLAYVQYISAWPRWEKPAAQQEGQEAAAYCLQLAPDSAVRMNVCITTNSPHLPHFTHAILQGIQQTQQ